jgi:murein DD-endopeptidase MepM/ murein hydrolase activator NlpD
VLDKKVQRIIAVSEPIDTEVAQGGIYLPVEDGLGDALNEQLVMNEVIYMAELTNMLNSLPTRAPVMRGRRTSGFGRRIDPFRRTWANHTGIDFSAPIGTKIHATADGKVVRAGYYRAYGNTIDIAHEGGIVTRYAHLSRIHVRVGTQVKAGQAIGTQGTTGRSTGHHLHYEVRYRNTPLNPDKFLQAGRYVSEIVN